MTLGNLNLELLAVIIPATIAICYGLFRLASNVRRANYQNEEIIKEIRATHVDFSNRLTEFSDKMVSVANDFAQVIKRADDRHVQIVELLAAERREHSDIGKALAIIQERLKHRG